MLSTDLAALADLLSRADKRLSDRLAAVLAAGGRALDEWRVLALLASRGGQSMSEISCALLLPPPTLTKRIDGMVADGLVHRRVDDRDRRRVLVLLAPRGRTAHQRLSRKVADEHDAVLRLTQSAELDLGVLARSLADLVRVLEGDAAGPTAPRPPDQEPGRALARPGPHGG